MAIDRGKEALIGGKEGRGGGCLAGLQRLGVKPAPGRRGAALPGRQS